jgi:hypothetical protein
MNMAWIAQGLLGAALTAAASGALAGIYSCVDTQGRRITSDRPIRECLAREQRVLNSDGSVKQVLPPSMTADEQAEHEARERQALAERAAQRDAMRRDRNLLTRFPNEASHQKAREAALDDVHKGVVFSERRLVDLERERKPLVDEAEFYAGKKLPLKLKQQLDANEAAASAQKSLIDNQKNEIVRINKLYDAELAHLKKLWAGATPGSLGPLPEPAPHKAAPKGSGK